MKVIAVLLIVICFGTHTMEQPPTAAGVLPEPPEKVSLPATPSNDDGSSTTGRSKRKEQPPMRALKKPRGQESFSIAYYLKNNPQMVLSRIKGNFLDLSHMSISSLDGLLAIPGIAQIAHISLAHNFIKQVKREDFARLGHLITLDLSSNLLEFLFTDSFAELESLSNLFLNNNIIRTIQHDSFTGLNSLKQLSLSGNRLQEISSGFFTGTENLEQLDLSDNQINTIEPYTFVRLTFLKKLKLNGNRLSQLTDAMFNVPKAQGYINIRTEKEKSFQFNNLEELDLRNNRLTTIPASILTRAPALQRLLLANNQIETINTSLINALAKLSNLKVLDLANNKLSESEVKKITAALSHTTVITTVAMEPALEIEQLVKMSQEKKLREQQQEESAAQILTQLPGNKNLDIYLKDPDFSFLSRIHELSKKDKWYELDHLNLANLKGLLHVPHIHEVFRIYLDSNNLTTIPARSFAGLNQLRDIILSSNKITTIDPHAFEGLPNLRSVYLNHNHLLVLRPEIMPQLKNVETLKFDENQIQNLPAYIFKDLTNLKDLSLGHNSLSSLRPEMFAGLNNLERLDLPANQFRHLDPSVFTPLKKLTFLNLLGNPLSKENVNAIQRALPEVNIFF